MSDTRELLPDLLQGTQVPLFEMRLAAYNEIKRLNERVAELEAELKRVFSSDSPSLEK